MNQFIFLMRYTYFTIICLYLYQSDLFAFLIIQFAFKAALTWQNNRCYFDSQFLAIVYFSFPFLLLMFEFLRSIR